MITLWREWSKRVVDIVLAGVGLTCMSPLLAAAGLAIRLSDNGPIFFVQERVGQRETLFTIYKLRSMEMVATREGQTYDSSPGVTRIGRVLRRTKLDEVPQLWNVLKGDMSLVGPRPCRPSLLETMPSWARVRFEVRPGLTGLAQINGNVSLSWEERWRYDRRYVRRQSLGMDFKILGATLRVVAFGEERISGGRAACGMP